MRLTETTVGQQIENPAALEPPPTDWLPLTAGDRELTGQAPPTHGWPASLFIFLSNLTAFGMGAGAAVVGLFTLVSPFEGDWRMTAGMALLTVGLALGCVVQRGLARHLKHFSRWGWYGAMAELVFLTLSKVNLIATEPSAAPGAAVGLVFNLLWMRYFWNHRADFDIDLGV